MLGDDWSPQAKCLGTLAMTVLFRGIPRGNAWGRFTLPFFFEGSSGEMLGDACHDPSFLRNPQANCLGTLDMIFRKASGRLASPFFCEVVSGEMPGGAWHHRSFFEGSSGEKLGGACHDLSILRSPQAKSLGTLAMTFPF